VGFGGPRAVDMLDVAVQLPVAVFAEMASGAATIASSAQTADAALALTVKTPPPSTSQSVGRRLMQSRLQET
jgi:hypothetical protein